MAGALPKLSLDSVGKADIASSQLKTFAAGKPPIESFKSKLAEARKSEKPKPADPPAARPKKAEKSAKSKNAKVNKKQKGDSDQDGSADSQAVTDASVDPAKDATKDQSQQQDPNPGAEAQHKPDAAADQSQTVSTPTLVLAQHVAASATKPADAPTPKPTTAAAKQPSPTIELKAKSPVDPLQLSAANSQANSNDAKSQATDASAGTDGPNAATQSGADPTAPVSPLLKSPKADHAGQTKDLSKSDSGSASGPDSSNSQSASNAPSNFSDILASFDTVQSFTDATSTDSSPATAAKTTAVDPATSSVVPDPTVPTPSSNGTTTVRTANAPASPQAAFNADNHPKIVQSVQTHLLPTGGTMRIRLDPPELGVLQVSVHVKNGITTASFETNNDEATKLLSHSMGQLKQALEAQGVTVGKMHVQQSPRNQSSNNQKSQDEQDSRQQPQDDAARQEQQRKEAMQRMWRKLSIGSDPLDLVA